MDPKKLHGKRPWITEDGSFDPAQFPIDTVLEQALSDDDQEFSSGLSMLQLMHVHRETPHWRPPRGLPSLTRFALER